MKGDTGDTGPEGPEGPQGAQGPQGPAGADGASLATVIDTLYPVGALYVSTLSTNPATLLGRGTWTAFGAGRTLVGFNAGETEFDAGEKTGGAKTHTLTTAEMPSHTHVQDAHAHGTVTDGGSVVNNGAGNAFATATQSGATGNLAVANATATNQSTGGGAAHNNLPPYIVVYLWKRTA